LRLGRKRTVPLLFFILLTSLLRAEPLQLGLHDAVKLAIDNSLSLQRSAIDLAQAGYSASRLWSEIFPSFNLSAGMTFLPATPYLTDPGFQYNQDMRSYTINLGLSLNLNASLRSSMRRIELAYRSQLLNYEGAVQQLEIQVIKDFLRLITRQEYLAIMQEALDLALVKLEQDRIARQNGLLSELLWLNSQLSAETARYNLSDALNSYQNALREFLALLGLDPDCDVEFTGSIEAIPLALDPEQLIEDHLPRRPDIIRQRQTIERLELTQNINILSARSPTLSVSTAWRGFSSPLSPLQRQGLNDPFSDSLSGSITLSIPIDSWIPGTRQNQNIRSGDAEIEKARLDLQSTETAAKTQIRSLISNLNNIQTSLDIARMRVELARGTLEATEVGFRNGTVEFRELEDRRRDLTDARHRLLEVEFSQQSLLLDLAAALHIDWKTVARSVE